MCNGLPYKADTRTGELYQQFSGLVAHCIRGTQAGNGIRSVEMAGLLLFIVMGPKMTKEPDPVGKESCCFPGFLLFMRLMVAVTVAAPSFTIMSD